MVSVLLKPFLVFCFVFFLSEMSRQMPLSYSFFFAPDTYPGLALKGVLLLGLYTVLAYALCLDPANRRALRGELQRVLADARN